MNKNETRYTQYALSREMMETADVIRNFDPARTAKVAALINQSGKLFLTGEGSSRIFPAKNTIRKSLQWGMDLCIATDGSRQALQYALSRYSVFCASNSGRTKEVVVLAKKLTGEGNTSCYALTANPDTLLEKVCHETFVLSCGWEQAVAATKSVIEQALFYESLLWNITGQVKNISCNALAAGVENALTLSIDPEIIRAAVAAPTIYFAGYNDGVAEELTLKTNEITRKKSDYLEGTYAVHGIEEVMDKQDIVFVVDPIEEEIEKFQEVLIKGVGSKVVAIADRETPFPTIRVPQVEAMSQYVYLAAGWNLLVEIGLALQINLDKPERARKVGNEFTG